ncbi:hypothetical protein [Sediminibacterium sp.]|uniref:hypothetical protein n=1 Tax=Sediminibacterium sp. TaxID=1917865 RepID=UPI0025F05D39|nr:hypothetical protein [Sediminibacterium sp.]MBW0177687.1 hypothetical protein [Sediminibacterium sp.]
MKWKKVGRIFENSGVHPKLQTHAANPLALPLTENVYRIFYSGRDADNRSSVSYFDYDFERMILVKDHVIPVVVHGGEDSFYSHGISLGNSFEVNGKKYINFMGWHIPPNEHWMGKIGRLAVDDTLNTLTVDPDQPFIDIDPADPISLSYPWIHYNHEVYQMWYGSTVYWNSETEEMLHVIKYAESRDTITWKKMEKSVPHIIGHSQAFSRPSVIQHEDGYDMWFSYRGKLNSKYRIGYATSPDGIEWKCEYDKVGIDVSANGWDNDMICYPFVFFRNKSLYMLYNGNGYGKSGIGLAILDK